MSYIQNKLDEFDKIVDGIDRDECEYEHGWWETSTGANWGRNKKDELSMFIKQIVIESYNQGKTDYHNHIVEKIEEWFEDRGTNMNFDILLSILQDTNQKE